MSGNKKQTQTTTNEPYKAAQPLLDTGMADALNQYKSGGLVKPNTMSTVVPYAGQTMAGLNNMEMLAKRELKAGSAMGDAFRATGNMVRSGGYNQQQQSAMGQLNPFAKGQKNVSTGQFSDIYSQATGPSYSERNLSDVAGGKFLGGGDPYFEEVLNRSKEAAQTAVNQNASSFGRYGSGTHQGVVADRIGGMEASARSDQYNRERQAQMAANQMMDSSRMAGLGMGLNAAGAGANVQAGNLDRQMGGINSLFNAGQTGQSNVMNAAQFLPTAYQNQLLPAETLSNVGAAYEDLAGRQLNDKLRIAQERQNAPLANIQALLAAAGGAGDYGTNTTSAQMPGSGFSNVMGGLLGGASLLRTQSQGGLL